MNSHRNEPFILLRRLPIHNAVWKSCSKYAVLSINTNIEFKYSYSAKRNFFEKVKKTQFNGKIMNKLNEYE